MSTETVKERFIHFLMHSASLNTKGETVVLLNSSKRELASYLGTTPETLSRQWTQLKKDGIISEPSKGIVKIKGVKLKDTVCKIM